MSTPVTSPPATSTKDRGGGGVGSPPQHESKQFLKQVPELEWQARRQRMAQSSVAMPSLLASASLDAAPGLGNSELPAHPSTTAKVVAKRYVLLEKLLLIICCPPRASFRPGVHGRCPSEERRTFVI